MREHEIELILSWVGLPKNAFCTLTDDNEKLPSLGYISREQVVAIINYAYKMGRDDATQP